MANRDDLGRPQFSQLKRCRKIGVEDRISYLPDELLSCILTRLSLKEVIVTSILSKRWNKLCISYPNLDFGPISTLEPEAFRQAVSNVMAKCNGPLHKFRIVYPMLGLSSCPIDDWIFLALRKGVSELELDFDILTSHSDPKNYYFPAHVFDGEKMINLNHCTPLLTTSPSVDKHFECLKHLCLRSVNLSNVVFHMILSSCCHLENFLLLFNHGLVIAKNTSPHLKLKSLELYNCWDFEKLELLAPNLVSFKYHGYERTLCIKDAQKLASLELLSRTDDRNNSKIFPRGKRFIFAQFSSYLPKLESFIVSVHTFGDLNVFSELRAFKNLKHLGLDVSCTRWISLGFQLAASIIREAPSLELLELNLPPIEPIYWHRINFQVPDFASMSPHQNLKEIKLYGFSGDNCIVEFLVYIMKYVISLQKLDITARGAKRDGDRLIMQRPFDWSVIAATICNEYVGQLRETLPANAQLLFHDD